jgi:hypothetical protein
MSSRYNPAAVADLVSTTLSGAQSVRFTSLAALPACVYGAIAGELGAPVALNVRRSGIRLAVK